MQRISTLAALSILTAVVMGLQGCAVAPLMHRGGIQVDTWAEIKADQKTVSEILATFNRAEEALHAGNLDSLMGLYSQGYSYHGLTKDDLKKVWAELLTHYQGLRSNHILSRIAVVSGKPSAIEITCTGSLWGISKETAQRVNVDSWFGEVHYLIYEDGAWRVRGHAGEAPRGLQFGVAPHPFF